MFPIENDRQRILLGQILSALDNGCLAVDILHIVQRFLDKESADHKYRSILERLTDIFAKIIAACDADARDLAGYAAAFKGMFDELLYDRFLDDENEDEDQELPHPDGWLFIQRVLISGQDLGDLAWLIKYQATNFENIMFTFEKPADADEKAYHAVCMGLILDATANIVRLCNTSPSDATMWQDAVNDMLDELRCSDFFGTEGQCDPRGDNRDNREDD